MRKADGPISVIELEGFDEGELNEFKSSVQNNLYAFAKGILHYKDLTPRTHKDFCDWLQNPNSKMKLGLMPRGHFKTSIEIANLIRLLTLDQNRRILLVSESGINAEAMLGEVKDHIANNQILQLLFHEIIPKSFGRNWNSDSILIPRTKLGIRENSIEAAGVGSKLVSRHYTDIFGDDIISDEAMYSPAVMSKAKDFVNRCISLTVEPLEDTICFIGTRWHFDDVYSHIMDKYPSCDVFIRKAIVHGKDGSPEPFFPERFSMEMFQRIIENDPDQWATQYANDPMDSSVVDFDRKWLQYFEFTKDRDIYYSDDSGLRYIQPIDELSIYTHIDPSLGEDPHNDFTAIVTVGLNCYKQIFVLDAWQGRIDAIVTTNKILDAAEYWWPRKTIIESNAYQKSLMQYVQEEARRRERWIRMEPYNAPSTKKKPARIRGALGPLFSAKRVWVRRGLTDFVDQYLSFGRSQHEHLLDAMAQGPDGGFWRYPPHEEAIKRRIRRAEAAKVDLGIAGYGI